MVVTVLCTARGLLLETFPKKKKDKKECGNPPYLKKFFGFKSCRPTFHLKTLRKYNCVTTYGDPQISMQASLEAHATSSGYKTRAAIPGKTIIHNGSSFNHEAKIHPPLACTIVLAAKALWTITWSEHQYHIEEIDNPNTEKYKHAFEKKNLYWITLYVKLKDLCNRYLFQSRGLCHSQLSQRKTLFIN